MSVWFTNNYWLLGEGADEEAKRWVAQDDHKQIVYSSPKAVEIVEDGKYLAPPLPLPPKPLTIVVIGDNDVASDLTLGVSHWGGEGGWVESHVHRSTEQALMSGRTVLNQISEVEFEAQYPLVKNHLNSNACWNGCMFETFGPEHVFVEQQDPRTVWTLVDDGEGGECILSGYHLVNRHGYFVSTVPVPEGTDIEVCWPQERDDEDFDEEEEA